MDPISSELDEERGDDMSSLAVGFVARVCKQAASAQGEITLSFEVLSGKCPKRSSRDEEAQKSPTVITEDSP